MNEHADFWRYQIGVNVLPADSKTKRPLVTWSEWQNSPIPEELHNTWKEQVVFSKGIAIIPGKVWHNEHKKDLYFIHLDADKKTAIDELCFRNGKSTTLQEMSQKFIVEQHKDNLQKAHVYFYSPIPFPKKDADSVLGLEVKGLGEHGVANCTASIHKNGQPWGIIGTTNPITLTADQAKELIQHIDHICKKYNLEYLEKHYRNLLDSDTKIYQGQRHDSMISIANSILFRYGCDGGGNSNTAAADDNMDPQLEQELKNRFVNVNDKRCMPPLPASEINQIWKDAVTYYIRTKRNEAATAGSLLSSHKAKAAEEISVAEAIRRKKGYVRVKGQLMGYSSIYDMIVKVKLVCSNNCGFDKTIDYIEKPRFRSPVKELSKCPMKSCAEQGPTLKAECEYITTIDVELQDPDKFSEIERIKVRLFEDNTKDIFAGKLVTVTGNLYVVRENDNPSNRPVTVLYAQSIEDAKKQHTELSQKDIEETILSWKENPTESEVAKAIATATASAGTAAAATATTLELGQSTSPSLVDKLATYFAPRIIGYEHVKKGLLMTAVNAGIPNDEKRIPKRLRINSLLIGDPSLAKSTFLDEIVKIVPNARYESCQSSTGLSLTAQVSKEEGGIYTLRHGPIPLASGSICALNEIDKMHISEHKHFLDCMQEGHFTLNKYGFNSPITANTSIVASANPINNTWKDPENIDQNEFPTLTQVTQRFDFIFIFIENTDPDYLRDYARKRDIIAKLSAAGAFDSYDNFLGKYLMYARAFQPVISGEARSMLNDYWTNMGLAGVRGLPRKLESLESAAIAIAKLKLKDVVEAEEVTEIMEFYNVILQYFRQSAAIAKNPRVIVYDECIDVVKSSRFPITFEEVIRSACKRNELVNRYVDGKYTLEQNKKLRPVLDMLLNHDHVIQISQRPIVLRWKIEEEVSSDKVLHSTDLSDLSDPGSSSQNFQNEDQMTTTADRIETENEKNEKFGMTCFIASYLAPIYTNHKCVLLLVK
jgi:DNA replicative helicase MCM subunit Mcm2 (Cdc46/Mcm family)